jgi:hypothetical protein
MRTIFTLAVLFACMSVLRAADPALEQKARQYAASTGYSYAECLNALEVGLWCKAHPQGGVLFGKVYDAKATAEILVNARRLLTEPKPAEQPDANQLRQQQLAQQYAAATGRSYDDCLWAVVTYEWCKTYPQGSVVQGVKYDAVATAHYLAKALQFLTTRAAQPVQIYANGGAAPAYPGTMYNTYRTGHSAMTFGSNGTMSNTYGTGNSSMTFGSDGTMYNTYRMGNSAMTFGSNGTMYNTYGTGNSSITFGSDGTMYNTYGTGNGSMTFGSDGTMYNTYGTGNSSMTFGN